MTARPVRILCVCTGNICRSPTAEAVLRHLIARVGGHGKLFVDSAGTHDYHVGDPPDSRSQAHGQRRGYDLSSLRARQLVAEDFTRFDVILCMDRANLAAARRIGRNGGTARLQLLMDYAPEQSVREVPDPYYGGEAGFETVLDLIEEAATGVIRELR